MYKEVFIRNFRGFKEKRLELKPGLNIVFGDNCTGKSSLVDSILFLQQYSYYAGNPHIHHPLIADPSTQVLAGEKEFTVAVRMSLAGIGDIYYRLDVETEHIMYTESFIIGDTVYTYSDGSLRIKNARRSRYTPEGYRFEGESIWDKLGVWRIKVGGLPWRNTAHLVSIETSHWGGIVEATRNVPEILSRIISARMGPETRVMTGGIRRRLRDFFKTIFLAHNFLRGTVIIKGIDFKNAIGPSKHLSMIMNPYASNFPWIFLNALRMGHGEAIRRDMEALGYTDREFSVASTIDNRFYLLMTMKGRAVYSTRLPYSLVKALIYVVASHFSNRYMIIDDYDEYLDEESSRRILERIRGNTDQLILTTRRKHLLGLDGHVITLK